MLPLTRKGAENGEDLKRFLAAWPGRVLVVADSAGRREGLVEQFAAASLRPEVVASWQAFARPSGTPSRFAIRM